MTDTYIVTRSASDFKSGLYVVLALVLFFLLRPRLRWRCSEHQDFTLSLICSAILLAGSPLTMSLCVVTNEWISTGCLHN